MKQIKVLIIALFFINIAVSQEQGIKLETNYGTDNTELKWLMRAEGIETDEFKFSGKELKGKNYRILVKEFTNGALSNVDTIINSKTNAYLKPINQDFFKVKVFVKTQINNTIKMSFAFNRLFSSKIYSIKETLDKYALHDFVSSKPSINIEVGKSTYIGTYFLPYHEKETGFKKYCQVAGSKNDPEKWGDVFNVSNYFLIEVKFE